MLFPEIEALSEDDRAARYSLFERVAMLPSEGRKQLMRRWNDQKLAYFETNWECRGRGSQQEPKGDWRVWLIMAGRGFGKTRAGAEWIHSMAKVPDARIALVGPTEDEARAVMVEGPSGVLSTADPLSRPVWEPSRGVLAWSSGARGFVYSGANPEALRGPEHDFAWCDEIAKWARLDESWDNLMFGLRRGRFPRVLATTTPRPIPFLRKLIARDDVTKTRGRTGDNAELAPGFVDYVAGLYGGTRLGRQELDGELIDDVEGSLWPRDLIDRCRARGPLHPASQGPPPRPGGELVRVVVGVDPPASVGGDACGIVVCGKSADGTGWVLEDASVAGLRPEGWANAVARAAERWGADRVVAEANQGGAMVESVLRAARAGLPVALVNATRGKSARAEPVAMLFERGEAKFAGAFPELEDELSGLTIGGGYEGPGRSPDRADAMVWAMTELMLKAERAVPRVRVL